MEQKTPARGNAFGRFRPASAPGQTPAASKPATSSPITPTATDRTIIARELAARVASVIPDKFEHVLPRGYTVANNGLIMARFEMEGTRGQALYGRHSHWGAKEAELFLKDIQEHWLSELSTYMRWQLRTDPVANATFQHALLHLQHDVAETLNIP